MLYNYVYETTKKIIKDKLRNVQKKKIQKEIYYLLSQDTNFNYTKNINGIYFNISVLNDDTLSKINDILEINKEIQGDKLIYKTYFLEKYNNDDDNFIPRRELNKLKACV